jgi:hypothetical protein
LPSDPLLTSDTGSDRPSPDQLFGAGNRSTPDRAGHQRRPAVRSHPWPSRSRPAVTLRAIPMQALPVLLPAGLLVHGALSQPVPAKRREFPVVLFFLPRTLPGDGYTPPLGATGLMPHGRAGNATGRPASRDHDPRPTRGDPLLLSTARRGAKRPRPSRTPERAGPLARRRPAQPGPRSRRPARPRLDTHQGITHADPVHRDPARHEQPCRLETKCADLAHMPK